MRKNIRPTLLALLLAALPAYGQFEGVVEMKITMAGKDGAASTSGTITVSVAKTGARSEANLQIGLKPMKMVTLLKANATNTLYRINDTDKTYTEIDLAQTRETAGQPPASDKYAVTKLGQETILGYPAQHVLVQEKNADAGKARMIDMWSGKDLLDFATFSKLQVRRGKADFDEALAKALKDAGADGLPLRFVSTTPQGSKVTLEAVKVDKQSFPASTFEIPAGYKKSANDAKGTMGDMSDPRAERAKQQMEQLQQRMKEAMKNATPEQRALIEQRMKLLKAGNQ
jgi:hypothetical protein